MLKKAKAPDLPSEANANLNYRIRSDYNFASIPRQENLSDAGVYL
jgi:hypothetical protein